MTAYRTLFLALAAALVGASTYFLLGRPVAGDLLILTSETDLEEPLARRLESARRLSDGKHQIVAELIAGRIDLEKAAHRFEELNALMSGDGNEDLIGTYRVVRGEEALWLSVLAWVELELQQKGDRAADDVLARLSAEYRERFGRVPGARRLLQFE
jgi:hypothetical protein